MEKSSLKPQEPRGGRGQESFVMLLFLSLTVNEVPVPPPKGGTLRYIKMAAL